MKCLSDKYMQTLFIFCYQEKRSHVLGEESPAAGKGVFKHIGLFSLERLCSDLTFSSPIQANILQFSLYLGLFFLIEKVFFFSYNMFWSIFLPQTTSRFSYPPSSIPPPLSSSSLKKTETTKNINKWKLKYTSNIQYNIYYT